LGRLQYRSRVQLLTLPINVQPTSVVRSQVVSTFIDAYTPADMYSSEIDILPNLVIQISMRPAKSEMLERALAAVSCIYLGRIKHDRTLLQAGIQHYEIATQHMSRMLCRMVRMDDMIYTTVIFQLLQVRWPQSVDISRLLKLNCVSLESLLPLRPSCLAGTYGRHQCPLEALLPICMY